MAKAVVLVILAALAGIFVGVIYGGGTLGRAVSDGVTDKAYALMRMMDEAPTPAARAPEAVPDASHFVFSACLRSSGDSVENTLRDLLEFHEHDATVALVGCLLDGAPERFCSTAGRQQAADAMEIYYWSRDDAHRGSPAHGLAAKIRLLDRGGEVLDNADPYVLTWSGPADRAIFDKLRQLAKDGYLEPSAFAFSGRAELREALRGVTAETSRCMNVARGD